MWHGYQQMHYRKTMPLKKVYKGQPAFESQELLKIKHKTRQNKKYDLF